jgi:putative membrane protein
MPAWHPHPDVWLLVAALAGTYVYALRRVGPRHVSPGEPPATRGQRRAFALGLLAIVVAAEWPLHDLGERSLFTAHMIQHLLMTLVAPPLLLLGTPGWLLRWALQPRWLMAVVRRLSRPLVAFVLFNATIAVTHWPAYVDLILTSQILHFATHALLFGAAFLMWMPVLSPIAEIPRLSYPLQMLYLFGQSILPTVPASFLTFGSTPLYRAYEEFPRLWGISALHDMQLAGLSMKLLGGFILWGVIAVLFFRWAKQEEDGVDDLAWQEVEQALNRREVTRP